MCRKVDMVLSTGIGPMLDSRLREEDDLVSISSFSWRGGDELK